jgi:hypothetical protein
VRGPGLRRPCQRRSRLVVSKRNADPFPVEFRVAPQEYDPAIPVEAITEHPANPNEGDEEILAESLDEHGFYGAVIVQRSTGHIIAGNTRHRRAVAAGAASIPGFWLDVGDEQAAKMLAVDNASTRAGAVNEGKLLDLLRPLSDLIGTGYKGSELDDMVARMTGQPTRGELLDLAGVTLGEPQHKVAEGQVWRFSLHHLAVVDVFTDWPLWVPLLSPGCVFLPYPTPLMPHGVTVPAVMVQPDLFLAGHLLDKWARVCGDTPELVG